MQIQNPRQRKLIDTLTVRRFLRLEEAIALTGSSLATIRRDFLALAQAGLAQRFRGGIRLPQSDTMLPFALRNSLYSEAKQRLAQRAAGLLRAGDVVFIDGGTTTAHLATCLPAVPLRILTSSVRLAAMLDEHCRRPDLDIYLTGGRLYPHSGLLVGPSAAASVDEYRAHWAFLSVGGLTADGLFNTTDSVVETERRMIAHAEKVVVIADHSKIGRTAMCRVCGIEAVDNLITEGTAPLEIVHEKLAECSVQSILI